MSRYKFDWEAIERDYRCGVKPLRGIATEQGCAESAIRKRAKAEGWERDLEAKIKARVESLVRKGEVRSQVRSETVTEKMEVEVNAQVQADILLARRKDIPHKKRIAEQIFKRLEFLVGEEDLTEQVILALGQGNNEALAKLANKVASLPSVIKMFSEHIGSYKVVTDLEDRAFGIKTGDQTPGEAFTEIVRRIVG